jgi:hypothetical protein
MNRRALPTQAERRVWTKFLVGMMQASKAGDNESAMLLLWSLGNTLGPDAVIGSVLYLADRAASPWLSDPVAGAGEVIGPVVLDPDGNPADIEDLPYPVRWSARLVAAAANRDHEAQYALVLAALDDEQMGTCLPVLAQMAACVPVEGLL